jgi:hypothetical protein
MLLLDGVLALDGVFPSHKPLPAPSDPLPSHPPAASPPRPPLQIPLRYLPDPLGGKVRRAEE